MAAELAVRRPVSGLILESPFPSVPAVVNVYYGRAPLHWLLSARYDLVARLKQIHVPLLVIHGDHDRIIPFGLGQRVYEAGNEPKAFYRVEGADHNDVYLVGGDAYFQRVIGFVRQVAGGG